MSSVIRSCLYGCLALLLSILLIASVSCVSTSKNKILYPPSKEKTYQQYKPADYIKKAYSASLSVFRTLVANNKTRLVGSATVIQCEKGKPIIAITANHVVDNIPAFYTYSIGNAAQFTLEDVNIAKQNQATDLAVLVGKEPRKTSCPIVSLATSFPKIGSTIWVIGSPSGHEKNITKGLLSSVYEKKHILYYRTDADIFFGNSGGGIFNKNNELIGVAQAIYISKSFNGNSYVDNYVIPGSGQLVGITEVYKILQQYL